MGEFDRPEWVLSEEELKAELCNAREVDWLAEASKEANLREQWMITATDEYDEYMQGLLKDGRNFPEIPLRYMDASADWMGKTLEVILHQIQSSPKEYQGYIMGMVNRYLTACEKRLGGKWPASKWDGSGNPFFTVNCYTFCCPEWVGDDDLLKKIIVLQKLQELIEGRLRLCASVDQAEAAGNDLVGEAVKREMHSRTKSSSYSEAVFTTLEAIYKAGSSQEKAVESLLKSCSMKPDGHAIARLLRAWRAWRAEGGKRKQKKIMKI